MPRELGQRFVDDGSVEFGRIADALVSSLVFTIGGIVGAVIVAFGSAWERVIGTTMALFGNILAAPWEAGTTMLTSAWQAAGAEFPMAGPWDFIIATVVVAATFWVAIWTIQFTRRWLL